MATTVSVSEQTRDRLIELMLDEGSTSLDEVIDGLILTHRKLKFRAESERFRRRLSNANLTIEDLTE